MFRYSISTSTSRVFYSLSSCWDSPDWVSLLTIYPERQLNEKRHSLYLSIVSWFDKFIGQRWPCGSCPINHHFIQSSEWLGFCLPHPLQTDSQVQTRRRVRRIHRVSCSVRQYWTWTWFCEFTGIITIQYNPMYGYRAVDFDFKWRAGILQKADTDPQSDLQWSGWRSALSGAVRGWRL